MARYVDADALATAIYEWMPKDQETWMESDIPPIENLVVSIMMTIEEQPTVDAVPVVMIESRINGLKKMLIDIDSDDVDNIWALRTEIDTLTELLEMWAERKEE